MSYNKVVLMGRIGKDAELRYTAAGKPVLEFSIATDSGWGENKQTDWHNCKMFGERSEKIVNFLTKGSMVLAEGRISYRQWDADDGSKRTRTDILVDNVELTGNKGSASQEATAPATKSAPKKAVRPPADEDDLPF